MYKSLILMLAISSSDRVAQFGSSSVHKFIDKETNVVCFVIPAEHCLGDCAYSPAISCVKL